MFYNVRGPKTLKKGSKSPSMLYRDTNATKKHALGKNPPEEQANQKKYIPCEEKKEEASYEKDKAIVSASCQYDLNILDE